MTDTLTEKEVAQIQNIVINQLHVGRDQLKPEAGLMADLGADSLDMVEIAMKVEEEFNVTASDEKMEGVVTMDDLYDAVADLLGRA